MTERMLYKRSEKLLAEAVKILVRSPFREETSDSDSCTRSGGEKKRSAQTSATSGVRFRIRSQRTPPRHSFQIFDVLLAQATEKLELCGSILRPTSPNLRFYFFLPIPRLLFWIHFVLQTVCTRFIRKFRLYNKFWVLKRLKNQHNGVFQNVILIVCSL